MDKIVGQRANHQQHPGLVVGFSPVMSQVGTLLSRKEAHMQNLWGDEERSQPTITRTPVDTMSTTIIHTAQDCLIYGHEWEQSELPGAKQCRVCGILGSCPSCVFLPPPDAQPFRCTRHSTTARKVYA